MKHKYTLAIAMLIAGASEGVRAQTNTVFNGGALNGGTLYIQANSNGNSSPYLEMNSSPNSASIGYVAGPNGPITGVAHNFMVQDGTGWPSVLKLMRNGRAGIGYHALDESIFGVYSEKASFFVDDLGSGTNQLANGSTCIGFNAIRQRNYDGFVRFGRNGTKNGGALIWADMDGAVSFSTFPSNGGAIGDAGSDQWVSPAQATGAYRRMRIGPTGQVQIGEFAPPTTSPHTNYRLAVDGKLVAKSVFVTQASTNWADFVFAPTYALRPLPELEAYLKQNRHLPAIPSAAEVEKNGVDLGEMNARLLQSLEELTLHVIELGKQNAYLQAEVTTLAARVNHATAPASSK